ADVTGAGWAVEVGATVVLPPEVQPVSMRTSPAATAPARTTFDIPDHFPRNIRRAPAELGIRCGSSSSGVCIPVNASPTLVAEFAPNRCHRVMYGRRKSGNADYGRAGPTWATPTKAGWPAAGHQAARPRGGDGRANRTCPAVGVSRTWTGLTPPWPEA